MVYTITFEVDGGCRGHGRHAIGAAAAVRRNRHGECVNSWSESLPRDPPPTNQRAEITAIILALEQAIEEAKCVSRHDIVVKISTDSRYAVGCMNDWIYKWVENGWINAAGRPVANQDIISQASDLDDEIRELAGVEYIWIPREENKLADRLCNEEMDRE